MSLSQIHPVGDDALAVRVATLEARNALAGWLRASGMWLDVVPGKEEVTVQFDPLGLLPAAAVRLLEDQVQSAPPPDALPARDITLHMRVDTASAPDLARLAAENGLTPENFIARISASPLIIDMMGFTAGFAYVAGVDPSLDAPRLDAPRQRVPAGSVGMLSGQLGFYALAGPAGWPIIGRVIEPLFEAHRTVPFTLEAGMRVTLLIER